MVKDCRYTISGSALLVLVALVMMAARFTLVGVSAAGPVSAGTWPIAGECPVLGCVANPDSQRYLTLAAYFQARAPLSENPLSLMQSGANFEESYLAAKKNGVAYSFVAALLGDMTGLSAAAATSLLSFLAALLLALTLRGFFARRKLSNCWLLAACVSPISTYYGIR